MQIIMAQLFKFCKVNNLFHLILKIISTNRVIGALLIGAAAGAVLGVLFAPEKGTDLRKKLVDSANDLSYDLKSKIREGKNLANQLKDSIVNSTEELINRGKDEANNAVNRAKQNVHQN